MAQQDFWTHLARPTLWLVHWLLGWAYSDLIYQPEQYLIGTDSFEAEIYYVCSGYEGITLICLFLAIYCWLFRNTLRFPQAFWLFPLGSAAIWLANSLRIALLIVVGTEISPDIASKGFHSQAGWIAFTLIALAAIAISHRVRFFSATTSHSALRHSPPLANALLVPFLVLIGGAMVTTAISAGFELLYPVRAIAAAAMLFYYRNAYRGLGWRGSWQAAAIGIAVFVPWVFWQASVDETQTELALGLARLPSWSANIWLAFRLVGAVIVVPIAEELAFRGYLMRKLIASDFERVDCKHFSWIAPVSSSACFGLLHDRWFAGTLAGLAYGLAWYRKGQIADAILAHLTTNGLIALIVLTQGRWSLWS